MYAFVWQKGSYLWWAWPNQIFLLKEESLLCLIAKEGAKKMHLAGLEEGKHQSCELPMEAIRQRSETIF